jgi:hypothetical protein
VTDAGGMQRSPHNKSGEWVPGLPWRHAETNYSDGKQRTQRVDRGTERRGEGEACRLVALRYESVDQFGRNPPTYYNGYGVLSVRNGESYRGMGANSSRTKRHKKKKAENTRR